MAAINEVPNEKNWVKGSFEISIDGEDVARLEEYHTKSGNRESKSLYRSRAGRCLQ